MTLMLNRILPVLAIPMIALFDLTMIASAASIPVPARGFVSSKSAKTWEEGLIKEWSTPKLENNDPHRHSSHIYELYDSLPDEIADSPELREALRKSIAYK